MCQKKRLFYDSLKLISAKKIFVVHENCQVRQINFTKCSGEFLCRLIFTDFEFSFIVLSKLIRTNFSVGNT